MSNSLRALAGLVALAVVAACAPRTPPATIEPAGTISGERSPTGKFGK